MIYKHWHIFLLMIIIIETAYSQDEISEKPCLLIGADIHHGFIMPHTKEIAYSVTGHVSGLNLSVSKQTFGRSKFDQNFGYPLLTFNYGIYDMGNREVFGFAHHFYPSISAPLNKGHVFNLTARFGMGITYATKIFDLEKNFKNIAIGSHLNFYITSGIGAKLRIGKRLDWKGNLNLSHFSNGRLVSPNQGLNVFTCSTGLNYHLNESKPTLINHPRSRPVKAYSYEFIMSVGTKTFQHYDPDRYFISSAVMNFYRNFFHIYSLGAGVDVFYDASLRNGLLVQFGEYKEIHLYKAGVHWANEFRYEDFSLVLQLGHYILQKHQDISNFYTRVGVKYTFNDHYIFRAGLKSHYAQADFVEWGIGYRW